MSGIGPNFWHFSPAMSGMFEPPYCASACITVTAAASSLHHCSHMQLPSPKGLLVANVIEGNVSERRQRTESSVFLRIGTASNALARGKTEMQVTAEVRGPVKEPYLQVHKDNALGMLLRPGSMEFGPRRSALRRTTFNAGEMGLCTPHSEQWIGTAEMEHLIVSISDAALTAACDRGGGRVELHPRWKMTDARLSSLLVAVNSERVAGFPSGRLFLYSVEQALAAALVNGYAECHRPVQTYRGGLSPARLRRVKEFVHAKMEDELSLGELAQSVGLSTAHFS